MPFPRGVEGAEAAQKSRALRFSPVPFRNATQFPWLSGDLQGPWDLRIPVQMWIVAPAELTHHVSQSPKPASVAYSKSSPLVV